MKRVYELFFKPGEVVEIRAIGRLGGKNKVWSGFCRSGVVSGYFNDADGFARAAASLNSISPDPPHGIYYTANPVRPDLLARAAGRLVASPKQSTQDSDIVCLRWLLVDMDPKRPAGISSSDEEKDAAKACGSKLTKWLEESLGFGRGVRANSGNGYHVLYRLDDLPNTDENKALLQKCLAAIGVRFNSDLIDIDQTVFNPARIWKLYGTHARKGDHITDRPWRQSMIMDSGALNSLDDIEITPIEKLEALAKMLPPEAAKKLPTSTAVSKPKPKARAKKSDALGELEVGRYLDHFGRRHFVKTEGSTQLFCLDECVFNPDHRGNEASVCQSPNPPYLTYQCFHNSCKGKTWSEAREIISGRESLAQFCAGFDPDYKARHTAANEMLKDIVVTPGDMSVFASAPVPPPHEMDPGAFFDMAGKRPKFVARWLANYMYALLGPIINYHSSFWRYQNGTWSEYSEDNLLRVGVLVLGDMVQPEYIDKSIKTLKGLVLKAPEEEWTEPDGLINCLDGMIDYLHLDRMEKALIPHDPNLFSRIQVPCHFNLDAECNRWAKFLKEIFPLDDEKGKAGMLQQYMGYCLVGHARYETAMILYGTGSNGKSKVLQVIENIVGEKNTATLSLTSLKHRFTTYVLENRLVNVASETSTNDPIATELLKRIVSGEKIDVERKFGDRYQIKPFAKWIVATNDVPIIQDKSYGFMRRMVILGFKRRFEKHERDTRLFEDGLQPERDGIFIWALGGLATLLKNGNFILPEEVEADTQQFMKSMNPAMNYVDECVVFDPNQGMGAVEFYENYRAWCSESGHRPMSKGNFYDQILMNYPQTKKSKERVTGRWVFRGCYLQWQPKGTGGV